MRKKKTDVELNEQVIYECKVHWIRLLIPAIIGIFFALSAVTGLFSSLSVEDKMIGFFGLLFCAALIFGVPYLRVKTNKLVLTDKRIYGKTGIFKTKELSSPISKIQTVNIDKKILGRVFGYADITIHCITGVYVFKKQKNAEEMQNAILNTIK